MRDTSKQNLGQVYHGRCDALKIEELIRTHVLFKRKYFFKDHNKKKKRNGTNQNKEIKIVLCIL